MVKVAINKPEGNSDRFKNIFAVEKQLNTKYDTKTALVRLGSKVGVDIPSISTGLPTLDYEVIGTGGIPRGRIVEFLGPESSGKTTLALHIIGREQGMGGVAAYIDAEHALDPTYAAKLGVDVDNLFVHQPDCGEQALEVAEAIIEGQGASLIVIDSVAALVPRAELEGEMGDAHMGLQARLMSQAMRKLTGIAAKSNTTLIFINQIRQKIGVIYGSPETTTGGVALKFYASLRLDIRRREAMLNTQKEIIGHQIKLKAVKNKVGVPAKETIVNLNYEGGFETFADFAQYAINIGVIEQSGAWFKFDGKQIGHGVNEVLDSLRNDVVLFDTICLEADKVRKTLNES